jgi:hypothetical protein
VRLKSDLLGSDFDCTILNAFLIEEIVWNRDAGLRCRSQHAVVANIRFFRRSKWAIAVLFIRSLHDGA